ncbi:MAG: DUF1232 domain-containing protein [Planctomycetaceae bacterium]|nr:DUF1232 domain-containing protein [Planctomycetaceae bacterium]
MLIASGRSSARHASTPSPRTMRTALLLVGCILYVISPIDLIPDPIVIIGWLDDVAVIAGTVKAISAGKKPCDGGAQ